MKCEMCEWFEHNEMGKGVCGKTKEPCHVSDSCIYYQRAEVEWG